MASTSAGNLWDLTGQSGRQTIPVGKKTTDANTSGTETTRATQSQSASRSINTQNTPQFALEALQQLIAQLGDRPGLSEEEAARKSPNLEKIWLGREAGYGWVDPATGRTYNLNSPEVSVINAQRAADRQRLIQQSGIIQGGTAEQKQNQQQRQIEIQRNRDQQAAYSKDAAINDANALTARFTRQLMEQLMPQISRAVEASGTSGGAIAGLLANDAATRTAEAQATLGLQTAVQYGQISNQLAPVLELLTRDTGGTTKALLEALGLARGTINVGGESSSQVTSGTSSTDKTANQSENAISIPLEPAKTPLKLTSLAASVAGAQNSGDGHMKVSVSSDPVALDEELKRILDRGGYSRNDKLIEL